MARKKQRTLGETLRTRREELGIGVRRLADAVGIAPSSLVRYEDGTNRPTVDTLRRLAKHLDSDPEELLGLGHYSLPSFAPYLRARYDLPEDEVAELEQHFLAVTKQRKPARRRQP